MPFIRRTRAIFLNAEFGFFGVCVFTCRQLPRFWGLPRKAGDFVFRCAFFRPWRISWFIVGISV